MPEEILFESERVRSRAAVAEHLRTVADRLDSGESITLGAGADELTLEPPERVEFEVKAEREGPSDAPGELSVEFELEWDENADADDSLTIS